jgi:serine/threonine-protein kinase
MGGTRRFHEGIRVHGEETSLIGSTLCDRYRLLEVIGEGGMGRVYRAEQIPTGKPVALKLLHPEFVGVDQVVRRFEREAQLTTELAHPHIVNVIELGEWNGRLFLAMELLAGKSLAELIGDGAKGGGRLTVKRTLSIIRPMLDALEYAHALGVVHRDLKPENIMIVPGGLLHRETIKLLDFGIAKLGDRSERPTGAAAQKLTQHGLVLGTPAYMSPEQAAGQEADLRSDIYSCGVMLYQMLTGRRPFEAESPFDVLRMHLDTRPKSLREVAAGAWIPDAVENVVLRAMSKRPAERHQSARELRQALEHAVVIDYGHAVGGAMEPPSSSRLSAGSRFLCLAIVAASAAVLVGDQLRQRRASAASRATAAAVAAPAPSSARDAGAAPPEIAREPSERPRRNVKHARAKRSSRSKSFALQSASEKR